MTKTVTSGRRGFPCAVCGRLVTRRPANATRPKHITCPRCRYMIYDYPRAAAGMLVVKRGHVLLLERAHAPRTGFLDVPGGFVEAGESLEAAARRELREETGLTLGRAEWLGFYWDTYFIQGFGRFPVMNFYFAGRWRRGEPRAADDAASAAWVPIASLPGLRRRFAWAHMTVLLRDFARWARGQKPGTHASHGYPGSARGVVCSRPSNTRPNQRPGGT